MSIYDPFSRDLEIVKGDSFSDGFQLYSDDDQHVIDDAELASVKIYSSLFGNVSCRYDRTTKAWYPVIGGDKTSLWTAGFYKYSLIVLYDGIDANGKYTAIYHGDLRVMESN